MNARKIMKNVKKRYESLQTLKANFKQIYFWELAGETQTLEGSLFLKSGNHYRIETDSQVVVTDGKQVWTYSPANHQVIIDYLSQSNENPLPKDLLFKYSEDYTPHLIGEEKIDGEKTYVLNLVPKDEDAFIKSMKIWVNESNWLTTKIEQTDINDNKNTYIVSDIEENVKLSDALFTFQIPPDAEIVDLR
ncbi:MAG: outer membrane lipoprotein carrier protein LolA [bacterium]